jgi:hypothetical protein
MSRALTPSGITDNGTLYKQKTDDLEYDHVFIYGYWRIFYTLEGGTAPRDSTDSNQDGVPDYIDSIAYRLETARILFTECFSLHDPTVEGFYYDLGVKYIDVYIQNIPRPMGIVSNLVFDRKYQILDDTPFQGKSLLIRLDRNLVPETSTPVHELFHLFQFNYTQIANLWFMEGIARWAQLLFEKRTISKNTLPSRGDELKKLLLQSHDAEVFWNRLADLCARENEFSLPDSLLTSTVIFQHNRTGIEFVKNFLMLLARYSETAEVEQKGRQLRKNTYWDAAQRRSANNNKYIFRAIIEAVNRACSNKTEELTDFVDLISPIAYSGAEAYDTQEIQLLMQFLHKLDSSFTKVDNTIIVSDHFDPFSGSLTLDLDLSDVPLTDDETRALLPLEHVAGDLIFKNNRQLSGLSGLKNLQTVSGKLVISTNNIERLKELNNLERAGELNISELPLLSSLSGLNRLKGARAISIANNSRLHSINGFNGLEEVERLLRISGNPVLGEINGFTSLSAITRGSLEIENNTALYAIHGFCSLKDISATLSLTDSPALENIAFLSPLKTVHSILFRRLNISSIAPLRRLFENSVHFRGYIKILHCPVTDLNSMRGIKSVGSSLYLHNNQLSDLSGLEDLERVGASFSLLENRLKDISQLAGLKEIDGMLGLGNNQLTTLQGLENLSRIRTIKWNGRHCSISVYGNKDLVDITPLSHINEKNKNIIVLVDSEQHFTGKPDRNSTFAGHKIKVLSRDYQIELETDKVCETPPWDEFETIAQCAAGTSCHLCRNQKYGYAWRQTLHGVTTLPPGGIDFDCPYGKAWSRYGYVSTSQQLSDTAPQHLSIPDQLAFASRHRDNQSFPQSKWGTSIDVVYPYFSAGQESDDELRFSLRSLSNLYEKTTVWIVGDKPDWLNIDMVNFIPHKKESSNRDIDSCTKVKLAALDSNIGSHFILMNDDIYFLAPVSSAYLGVPRYFADYTHNLNDFKVRVEYHKLELSGLKILQKKQRPMRNYCLHWPYVYNTGLYLKIYEEFELDKNPHNSETLYYNTYAEAVIPYCGDLLRSNEGVKEEFKLENIPKNILILNNKVHGFNQIRRLLSQLFPNPCDYEKQRV